MSECQIFYAKHGKQQGWKWRPLQPQGPGQPCKETYQLFYECVTAARSSGYRPVPALKCA